MLHIPERVSTETQWRLAQERRERLARMSPAPKVTAQVHEPVEAVAAESEYSAIHQEMRKQYDIAWEMIEHSNHVGPIRITDVISTIRSAFGITKTEFICPQRTKRLTYPRHLSFYICKKYLNKSLPEIGLRHGRRDHTTVLHGFRRIEEALLKGDETVTRDVAMLKSTLGIFASDE